jgi:hypothetical protein
MQKGLAEGGVWGFYTILYIVVKLLQLNHYKGLGGNGKLTPDMIATVGIVQ